MTQNRKYGRQSIRLKNYNYAANGYYFVTICTQGKQCFFGNVVGGKMQLSTVGKIAHQYWSETPQHSQHTYNDPTCTDVTCNVRTENGEWDLSQTMSQLSPKSGTLSVIIRSYKSSVTRWCRQHGDDIFQWQSRFYENIIRDDKSLNNIRRYIINNPAKWTEDRNYIN